MSLNLTILVAAGGEDINSPGRTLHIMVNLLRIEALPPDAQSTLVLPFSGCLAMLSNSLGFDYFICKMAKINDVYCVDLVKGYQVFKNHVQYRVRT